MADLKTRILLRNDILANWVSKNPVLGKGEFAVVFDPSVTGDRKIRVKVGDGVSNFNSLPFLADYDAKFAEVEEAIEALQQEVDKKVDKEIVGTNGKALIFNESDGGGAKFVHNDGTESFVGVNDGGKDGIVAQIYADRLVGGKWSGAKLDVKNGGIYYTVGDKSAAERCIPDNELVTKKDIKDLEGGMHYIGKTELLAGETFQQAIDRLLLEKQHVAKAGDIVIIQATDSAREFIYDGETWQEVGDEGYYATKAELAQEVSDRQSAVSAEAQAREEADLALDGKISAEETRAKAEEAKKLEAYQVTVNGIAGKYVGEANVPVYFDIEQASNKVVVNSYAIKLNTTKEQVAQVNSLEINAASIDKAGLMSASDKVEVNKVVNKADISYVDSGLAEKQDKITIIDCGNASDWE